MRTFAMMLMVLVASCGRSDMLPDGTPAALTSTVDGGAVDAGERDAGAPDSGTADAGMWCAPEAGECLADGWQFGEPGRCCLSRQTCKVAGRYRRCAY